MEKAKITIAGNAVVVTSALKLEDYRTIAKYRPDALILNGGEDGKTPIFAVAVTDRGNGEINKYGATFGSESHDEAKLATITMAADCVGNDDIKEFVADQIGSAVINLHKLEETLPAVLEEITAEKAAVMESISVAQ